MTSYTLPEGGLSEVHMFQKRLGSPCTMIQQSVLLACSAISGPVRTRASDISSCTCGQWASTGRCAGLVGTAANRAAGSFQGSPAGRAESASLSGQSRVPRGIEFAGWRRGRGHSAAWRGGGGSAEPMGAGIDRKGVCETVEVRRW